jgi:glutathione S-transferase
LSNARILWGAGTSRTLRAHWALQELELEYDARAIGSRTGETQTDEFRRLNPREKIPVLQDGDLILAESAAITTYLAERYGAASGTIPSAGTNERAHYYEWAFFIMTELDAHTLYVIRRHRDLAELYGDAPNAVRAAEEGFAKQVAVAAQTLEDGRPYLLGDTFTGVDILLASCLGWALFCQLPLAPVLSEYLKRTSDRDAYRRAVALNFPPHLRP